MNIYLKIMAKKLEKNEPVTISLHGTSMYPALKENDLITIISCENYKVGDILVFLYKENELLAHRLLKIENDIYYCKGDNAFRIEDIKRSQILGCIVSIKRGLYAFSPNCGSAEFIKMSYMVGREFRKNNSQKKSLRCRIDLGHFNLTL